MKRLRDEAFQFADNFPTAREFWRWYKECEEVIEQKLGSESDELTEFRKLPAKLSQCQQWKFNFLELLADQADNAVPIEYRDNLPRQLFADAADILLLAAPSVEGRSGK